MTIATRGQSPRRISAEGAARLVQSGDWLDYGANLCQPDVFDLALAQRSAELHDVKIRACMSLRPRAVLEADPQRKHFHWYNWHFGGYDRKKGDAGQAHYIPCNLGEIGDYYTRFIDPPEVVVLKTCPMDSKGFFNFSGANLWHRAVALRGKVVIVEVTEGLPYLHGFENGVHASEVDYIMEGDHRPVPELPNAAPTDVDRAVAKLIATEIEDGACLHACMPAGRHWRHAQCGVFHVAAQWCAQSRCAHRDAHGRHHRFVSGGHRYRCRQTARCWQDGFQLRAAT